MVSPLGVSQLDVIVMRSNRLTRLVKSLLAALFLAVILATACAEPLPVPDASPSPISEKTSVSETYKIRLQHSWGAAENHFFEQYAAIVTDYFGRTHNTTIFGLITLAGGIGGGLFPLIGGWFVDITGNYYFTLMFLGVGMLIASVLAILSSRPKLKM